MPERPAMTLTADDAAKAEEKGKTVDFYGDLTDEERAEEGLPARPGSETPPAEPEKPTETPEPAKPAEPEPTPDEEDETVRELFDEIAGLREDLTAALGKPEPAKEGKEDPLLAAAREHDDPVMKGLAERIESLQKQVAEQQERSQADFIARQAERDNADFNLVRGQYSIDGKPLTVEHRDAIEDWVLQHPEAGAVLSWPELVRVVHPQAVRAPKRSASKPPTEPAAPNGAPVATIVDQGATAPAGAGAKWSPKANDDMASAINEAGRRLFPSVRR